MTGTIDPKCRVLAEHFLRATSFTSESMKQRMTTLLALRVQQEAEGCVSVIEALEEVTP